MKMTIEKLKRAPLMSKAQLQEVSAQLEQAATCVARARTIAVRSRRRLDKTVDDHLDFLTDWYRIFVTLSAHAAVLPMTAPWEKQQKRKRGRK